ncbi:MAG: T9SS type A sorting domain-containing protein [Crocinitomicaceae bacterium]|nr:T9SS type A sorting domain-containing protein [Crocinitomicaceae bacterium]
MKKLLLLGFGLIAWSAYSQFEIRKPGETTDLSGQTITVNITTDDVDPTDQWAYWADTKFHVYNLSSQDVKLRLERKINVAATDWDDQICWPPTCYPTSGVTIYLTPNSGSNSAPIVYAGGTTTDKSNAPAEIKPQIYPKHPGSSATYVYTVIDADNNTRYDSIIVTYNYINTVSINNVVKTSEVSFSPNPASDFVTIQAENITDGDIQIVDVLGNVIYQNKFNATKKINTAEFKNGIYIVSISGNNSKGVTKKLVIRH